jgi:hypothetical protein
MADTDTTPAPTAAPDTNAILNQYIQALMQGGGGGVTGPAAPATPAVNRDLSVTGMLGEALGGGVSPVYPMSQAQQEQAGNAALLNFGIGMLQNASGPVRHSLGQAIASGLLGAQGSLAGVREGQAQMVDIQNKQQQMQLERLKEVLPLLRMQQGANMPNLLMGGGAPPGAGGIAATGAPIGSGSATPLTGDMAHDLPIIRQRESGGDYGALNYVAKADPSAYDRGATGSGAYQIVNSTWAEGMKLAGLDPSKYATAASAPPAVQDQVAQALYGKYGTKPWDSSQFKQNWVQGADGKYTLQPTGGGKAPPTQAAGMPPAATPPAPAAKSTGAPAAPPGTIQGAPDTGGTLVGGPGALPGKITPPGPAVPGDVKAIIGGMTGAGASPTTLAPGTATAGPIAPPVSTVVASNAPTPQQPTQADQPPAIGGQTWEQFLTQHMPQPTPEEVQTWHQGPDPATVNEAAAAKATAAQELAGARANFGVGSKEANDANTRYQEASKSLATLQQQYSKQNVDTYQNWMDKQKTLLAPLFKNQQDIAAQTALKAQEGQQAIDLAKVQAGQTWHQKLEEQSAQYAQDNVLKPMTEQGLKAHQLNLSLAQLPPLLQNLPPSGGALGAVLTANPDLRWLTTAAGITDPKQADALGLVNGLVANITAQMKPVGLGAQREYEWNAFKGELPSMLSTRDGQLKAVAILMNMNQRIQDEASWMNNYFNRKVPDELATTPGATRSAHNLDPSEGALSAQQLMDKQLGPIIPQYTGPPSAAGQAQWEQTLPPGKPFYRLKSVPDPKDPTKALRDNNGNVVTTKTYEVRPWQ